MKFYGGTQVKWEFWKEFNYSWKEMMGGILGSSILWVISLWLVFLLGWNHPQNEPTMDIAIMVIISVISTCIVSSWFIINALRDWEGKQPWRYQRGIINSQGKRDW